MTQQILAMFLHIWLYHSQSTHVEAGHYGWAAWTIRPNVQDVFGFTRGHWFSAYEVRS